MDLENDYLTFERKTFAGGEELGKWFNKINTVGTTTLSLSRSLHRLEHREEVEDDGRRGDIIIS